MEKTKKQVEQEKSDLQMALEEVEASVGEGREGSTPKAGRLDQTFGAASCQEGRDSVGKNLQPSLEKQLCCDSSPGCPLVHHITPFANK